MEISILKIPVMTGSPDLAVSIRVEGAAAVQRYDTSAALSADGYLPDRSLAPTYR